MAILVPVSGPTREVFPADLVEGFSCQECYALLSCRTIEVVQTLSGKYMVIDEEGKLVDKPVNERATDLFGYRGLDHIVGDALICEPGELR